MTASKKTGIAIWAITPNGFKLAECLRRRLVDSDVYISNNLGRPASKHITFKSLKDKLSKNFNNYSGHIFIMSVGIVVRVIAPLIVHKTKDPAAVVVDDGGNFAISLLSGHLGGANELTRRIADVIGARPVITTATDVNQLPAIDILAKEAKLRIGNPTAVKYVNMALVKGEKIYVHDPFNFLKDRLPEDVSIKFDEFKKRLGKGSQATDIISYPGVFVDDVLQELPPSILVLRPASLVAGIGCNRNTKTDEIKSLLEKVLATAGLSPASLNCLASIDVKADEDGLIALGREMDLPLVFFTRHELKKVMSIENPSIVVEKYVGVKSVCEAAAILAARNGNLVVPKHKTKNVTVAIARINYSSLESDPAVPSI